MCGPMPRLLFHPLPPDGEENSVWAPLIGTNSRLESAEEKPAVPNGSGRRQKNQVIHTIGVLNSKYMPKLPVFGAIGAN